MVMEININGETIPFDGTSGLGPVFIFIILEGGE